MYDQLHPIPEPGDYLPPELDDQVEYLETGDFVEYWLRGSAEPRYGEIVKVNVETQWAVIQAASGIRRAVHVDDLRLVLKQAALTITAEAATISA